MAAAPTPDKVEKIIPIATDRVINPEEVAPKAAEKPVAAAAASPIDTKMKEAGTISIYEKREDARGRLALVFTIATFTLFGLGFLLAVFTEGDKISNFKETFITISGIFSGLLGFVVGFYFRKGEEK